MMLKPIDDYDPAWIEWNKTYPEIRRSVGADVSAEPEEPEGAPEPEPEPEPEAAATPEPEPEVEEPEAEDPEAEATPPTKPEKPWYLNRIDTLTARNARATAEAERLKRELDQLRGANAPDDSADNGLTQERFSEEVQRTAAQLAAQNAFNERCNQVNEVGVEKYGGDFTRSVENLNRLADPNDPDSIGRFYGFLDAAIEAGGDSAADLLHTLGEDLNEASKILSLPPTRMAVELAKRANGATKSPGAKSPSKAPAPHKPVTGRTSDDAINPTDPDNADNLSTAEWIARRNKQLASA